MPTTMTTATPDGPPGSSMRVIRKSSFSAIPWKNGGGVTHEAIRVPALGDRFQWRLSVAQLETSGPFSDFSGYHRIMVLLRGAGVDLKFGDSHRRTLANIGDLVEFDGAIPVDCELLAGPCADLNLMVAKSMQGTKAWIHALREPIELPLRHATTLVFGVSGELFVKAAEGAAVHLEPWDLAVLSPLDRGTIEPAVSDPPATPLVFFATLDDNLP
jgi:uncharacterized protein